MRISFEQFSTTYGELREAWGNKNTSLEDLEALYLKTIAEALFCEDDRPSTYLDAIMSEYERRLPYFLWSGTPQREVIRARVSKFYGGNHYYVKFRNVDHGIDESFRLNTRGEAMACLSTESDKFIKRGFRIELEGGTYSVGLAEGD